MTTLTQTVLADGRIELSGPTFAVREAIKAAAVAAGGKAVWDGARKVWTVPAGTVVPAPAPAARGRADWTREEWQTWITAFKSRNRGRVERCCCHAKSIGDFYGPSHYMCERHGETRGTYCGD
jgi:hypothetical protein